MTTEQESPKDVSSWRDPEMDSVKGTETPKDPNKGYIALLGWSVNAIKAAQKFNRRYVVVAPEWATDFCEANKIPFIPWDFLRLNDITDSFVETGLTSPEMSGRHSWDPYSEPDTETLINVAAALATRINYVNRSMGLADIYPFTLSEMALRKLTFVHNWLRRGAQGL